MCIRDSLDCDVGLGTVNREVCKCFCARQLIDPADTISPRPGRLQAPADESLRQPRSCALAWSQAEATNELLSPECCRCTGNPHPNSLCCYRMTALYLDRAAIE